MKTTKKVLALLLALVLLALSASAAFAAAPTDACPEIYIHGYMGSDILADRNDPESEEIWAPDMNAMFGDIKDALPAMLLALATKDWERLGDKMLAVVDPYFRPIFYGNDGTPANSAGVWFEYPEYIDKDSEVSFRYDWREDPLKTAADLNDFIEYVCAAAGVQQVRIHAHSYGGTVLTTYLTLYGNERVRTAVFDSTAIFGETYTGELMTGHIVFDPQSLEDYLKYSFAGGEYDTSLTELLKTARVMGLTDLLAKLANELVDAQGERVMRELLLPMFANWPSVWAMIPDKDVEASEHFIFDEIGKDDDRSGLREKVEAYNTLVRPYKTETLKALDEKANVYVISRTGYSSIPITPSYGNLSDGTVDTMYSSFGATTAEYGKQLPESALEGKDPSYISPNKDIDASTCLFPEQTWFVRGAKHPNHDYAGLNALIELQLSSPTQFTVNTYPEFPRFLTLDPETGVMQPEKADSSTANTGVGKALGILARVRDFLLELTKIVKLIMGFLKK